MCCIISICLSVLLILSCSKIPKLILIKLNVELNEFDNLVTRYQTRDNNLECIVSLRSWRKLSCKERKKFMIIIIKLRKTQKFKKIRIIDNKSGIKLMSYEYGHILCSDKND